MKGRTLRSGRRLLLATLLGLVAAGGSLTSAQARGTDDPPQGDGPKRLLVWAYFDGDTPLSEAEVRVYADGRQLGDPVRTHPQGTALVRLPALPERLRVVVGGGEARGKRVEGSLSTELRDVADGDVVDVNPVTTLVDAWKDAGPDRNAARGRDVIERLLGIDRILDDADLLATDRWFDGDEFVDWAADRGSIGDAVDDLVRRVEGPGDERRPFRPPDGDGGSPPRAAIDVAAGADAVLGALVDHITTAAGFTGPEGMVFGLALKALKGLITQQLEAKSEIEEVKAALEGIAVQIAQLKAQVGEAVFQIQVEGTRREIVKIEAAQRDLDYAMRLPISTERGRKDVAEATAEFVKDAERLRGVALELHSALTQTQPEGAPALLPGVRRKIGAERFFTADSSRRIRSFFGYYEWWQTRLADLQSEYHTLNGETSTAIQRVREIKDEFLPLQRRVLPARRLDPSVFIDTKTNLMWGVTPLYRSSAQIPQYGFTDCQANFLGVKRCNLNAKTQFAGYSDWTLATESQAKGLFDDRGGVDPVAWLERAGLRFNGSPGWNPAQLEQRLSLWLRDKFSVVERGTIFRHETIDAQLLVLQPGRGWERDINPPGLHSQSVAENCTVANPPACKSPNQRAGGFFLWVRPTTAAERGQYW
ncbi:MAG TPA: hypothetical protein VFY99_03450 [Solirubrobacterales bacterium]